MIKVKVMVFPCGTEIGLEIHNSLRFSNHIELIGANSVADHGKVVYKNYIEGIPFVDHPDFIKKIKKIVKEQKVDFIFPAHDCVVLKLAKEVNSLGCKLLTSSLNTCEICRSKGKTYQFFSKLLRVPKVYKITDKHLTFPVFLKLDVGQGSKGNYTVNSLEEIKFYLKRAPTLLILEYLPGKEYTIDCFTDRHGVLRFVGPRERVRILNGISVNSFPVKKPVVRKIAEVINKNLKLRGVWFFQVKEAKDGELVLMEIAPRVGGTMGLTRNMGVNLPLLTIFDAMDIAVSIDKHTYRIEVDRALISRYKINLNYNHLYIDLDDTIIFNDAINPFIITFLYQCRNRGIKIHLLSRHERTYGEPVNKALEKFKIKQIFDEIVDVPDDKEKYEYINKDDSIFMDDSFSERKKVVDKLGIHAFDTNEVESLIDWTY
jgi:Carbamoylphosphate synthase large subunit (split gene in MJ)